MRLLVSALIAVLSFPTFSATKVNLFDSEVLIVEQEEGARYSGEELARREGMKQVIIRATGNETALENDVIRKAITQSSRYLSRLSYGEVEVEPTEPTIESEFDLITESDLIELESEPEILTQTTLKMTFSAQQIKSLLAKAQIPYWPEERSTVLVWIVEESQFQRDIAWEQTGKLSVTSLKEAATERGLPIIVPVGDITDITAIQTTELWGGFVDTISDASSRYLAEAVVVVKLMGSESNRNLTFTLYDDHPKYIAEPGMKPIYGEYSGSTESVMEQLVETLGNHYALKSAAKINGESIGSVFVEFVGLTGAQHYFEVEELIAGLPSVATVALEKVKGTGVTFKVDLLGSVDEFQRQILRSEKISGLIPPPNPAMDEFSVDDEPLVLDEPLLPNDLATSNETVDAQESVDAAIASDYVAPENSQEFDEIVSELNESTGMESIEEADSKTLLFQWGD
jgi:hypothetical protein